MAFLSLRIRAFWFFLVILFGCVDDFDLLGTDAEVAPHKQKSGYSLSGAITLPNQ